MMDGNISVKFFDKACGIVLAFSFEILQFPCLRIIKSKRFYRGRIFQIYLYPLYNP